MLLFVVLAALASARPRHRHRTHRHRMSRILRSLNEDNAVFKAPSPKGDITADKFMLLTTMLDKPEALNLRAMEAQSLMLLYALNRQKKK